MNPDTRLYYDRYVHNAALAMRIEQALGSDADWAVVAYFYAALHLMNAYLLNKKNRLLSFLRHVYNIRDSFGAKAS